MELPRKPGQSKQAKKQRTRRKRQEAKKIDAENPLHNKYHGYH